MNKHELFLNKHASVTQIPFKVGLDLDLGYTSLDLEHLENFVNYK